MIVSETEKKAKSRLENKSLNNPGIGHDYVGGDACMFIVDENDGCTSRSPRRTLQMLLLQSRIGAV